MRAGITLFVSGCLLIFFGLSMLIPASIDLYSKQIGFSQAFTTSSVLTIFFGTLLLCTFYNKYDKLTIKEMYLTTSLVWIIGCVFVALPFYFSPLKLSYTDSFFEAMSGLTTMGATIIPKLELCSKGILFWRIFLQWIGGLGIIVIALGILPILRVGGMQLFSMECSDKSGKKMPKTSQVIATMMIIYCCYTIACLICLKIAGMSFFEAISFSMATISTGGFGLKESSAIEIGSACQWIIAFFMFISGLPILLAYTFIKKDWKQLKNDVQVKTYTYFTLISSFILFCWLKYRFPNYDILSLIKISLFSIISVITSTCFSIGDIEQWGDFAIFLFTLLIPIGACSGSTSGGIKFFRFNILYLFTINYLQKKLMPHGVFISKYDNHPIDSEISSSVLVFIAVFFITFICSCFLLSLFDLDIITVGTSVLSALGNSGLAFGKVVGSSGGFYNLPQCAKLILAADMMLGRLEYISVFVVLLPITWRSYNANKSSKLIS
ncbi:MAG: TrkH family potassium uptake protein [Alphaproteobacteria bacterium]|nr:TrkH family potassium uptake protein [Alphaproteobacteria bacterium]